MDNRHNFKFPGIKGTIDITFPVIKWTIDVTSSFLELKGQKTRLQFSWN